MPSLTFTKMDVTESWNYPGSQETNPWKKKFTNEPSIKFFDYESSLPEFLQDKCRSSTIDEETSHTASTDSESHISRISDEDASISEADLFESLASIDFDINLDDLLYENEGAIIDPISSTQNVSQGEPKEECQL